MVVLLGHEVLRSVVMVGLVVVFVSILFSVSWEIILLELLRWGILVRDLVEKAVSVSTVRFKVNR